MGAQFGRWNFDGTNSCPDYLQKVRALLAPYGPDGGAYYSQPGIHLLYQAFHTTSESARESQPYASSSGAILTWDGRLDNRDDLTDELGLELSLRKTDVSIVAAAYERWKSECLQKLIGDWALSIWDQRERLLLLAKDFIGTRPLYYSIADNHVSWSSVLEPLVLVSGRSFFLDEEYLAGWLASFSATHLTPFAGIHAVPPAGLVTLAAGRHGVRKYWDFDGGKRIRYRTDGEYEEHFRTVFAASVRRRLRSNGPVLAELSGGMDSSSIVCMADCLTATTTGQYPVDTVSYYSKSEPHWDERPYFTIVEARRGKAGLHIDADAPWPAEPEASRDRVPLWPGGCRGWFHSELIDWMGGHGHRVLLSGVGGDECLGGVPTPVPEFEDLLVQGKFLQLAHQLRIWALLERRPWFHLLGEAVAGFLPSTLRPLPQHRRPGAWLTPRFVRCHRSALSGYDKRWKLLGPPPSFQENLSALDALRRQLASTELWAGYPYEKRYPYLDRELLEFLYALPREQLVRPGRRRSLLRRSLTGIVPDEILERRRKAYVTRAPLATIARQYEGLLGVGDDLVSASLGVVIAKDLLAVVKSAQQGKGVPAVPLLRTLGMEQWLRSLRASGFLKGSMVSFP
jgi:asparagine synthase (glutamine-hydrolysing)